MPDGRTTTHNFTTTTTAQQLRSSMEQRHQGALRMVHQGRTLALGTLRGSGVQHRDTIHASTRLRGGTRHGSPPATIGEQIDEFWTDLVINEIDELDRLLSHATGRRPPTPCTPTSTVDLVISEIDELDRLLTTLSPTAPTPTPAPAPEPARAPTPPPGPASAPTPTPTHTPARTDAGALPSFTPAACQHSHTQAPAPAPAPKEEPPDEFPQEGECPFDLNALDGIAHDPRYSEPEPSDDEYPALAGDDDSGPEIDDACSSCSTCIPGKALDEWTRAETSCEAPYKDPPPKKPKRPKQHDTPTGVFQASTAYHGHYDGWIFATREHVTGYYKEVTPTPMTTPIFLRAAAKCKPTPKPPTTSTSRTRHARKPDGARWRNTRHDVWKKFNDASTDGIPNATMQQATKDTAHSTHPQAGTEPHPSTVTPAAPGTPAAHSCTSNTVTHTNQLLAPPTPTAVDHREFQKLCAGRHTETEDKWWKKYGLWSIDTCNGNSSHTAIPWLKRSCADITTLQELKNASDAAVTSCASRARRAGWNVHPTLAHLTATNAASGGMGVAARVGIGIQDNTDKAVPPAFRHRIALAHVNAVFKGGLTVGSIWLRHTEGVSELNLGILQQAAIAIKQIRGPWAFGGDWKHVARKAQINGMARPGRRGHCVHWPTYLSCVRLRLLRRIQRHARCGSRSHRPAHRRRRNEAALPCAADSQGRRQT